MANYETGKLNRFRPVSANLQVIYVYLKFDKLNFNDNQIKRLHPHSTVLLIVFV